MISEVEGKDGIMIPFSSNNQKIKREKGYSTLPEKNELHGWFANKIGMARFFIMEP